MVTIGGNLQYRLQSYFMTRVHISALLFILTLGAVFQSFAQPRIHPGDVNNDGRADMYDLLPIGIYFGETGPTRTDSGKVWDPHSGTKWGDTMFSKVDIKHADCNGDGIIDREDVGRIQFFYDSMHTDASYVVAMSSGSSGAPKFLFDFPVDSVMIRDSNIMVKIPLYLGSASRPLKNLYGVAFKVIVDTAHVKLESLDFKFFGSWLSDKTTLDDVITIKKNHENGVLDVAIARNDHLYPSDSGGPIGYLSLVVEGWIAEKPVSGYIDFEVAGVVGLTKWGNLVDLNGISDSLKYFAIPASLKEIGSKYEVLVYPVPAQDELHIWSDGYMDAIEIYDPTGRLVYYEEPNDHGQITLPLKELNAGVYYLRISLSDGILTKPIALIDN